MGLPVGQSLGSGKEQSVKKHNIAVICGLLAVTAVGLGAKQGVATLVPRVQNMKFAEPWRPNSGSGATRVIGTVIDIKQTPVKRAKVQLRNLTTGVVEEVTESNENGEYEFEMDSSGSYVVEMVLVDGQILSLSNAGSVARYETMQTVIMLPGRWDAVASNMIPQQGFSTFMGVSAETTMTATTITIANNQNIPPVNSGEPVSP